jgi:hypothetical protein
MLLNDKQGGFVVVNSPEKADGVFSGRVVDSSISSRSYSKEHRLALDFLAIIVHTWTYGKEI